MRKVDHEEYSSLFGTDDVERLYYRQLSCLANGGAAGGRKISGVSKDFESGSSVQ